MLYTWRIIYRDVNVGFFLNGIQQLCLFSQRMSLYISSCCLLKREISLPIFLMSSLSGTSLFSLNVFIIHLLLSSLILLTRFWLFYSLFLRKRFYFDQASFLPFILVNFLYSSVLITSAHIYVNIFPLHSFDVFCYPVLASCDEILARLFSIFLIF